MFSPLKKKIFFCFFLQLFCLNPFAIVKSEDKKKDSTCLGHACKIGCLWNLFSDFMKHRDKSFSYRLNQRDIKPTASKKDTKKGYRGKSQNE